MAEILGVIDKYCIVPVRKLFYFHHWLNHNHSALVLYSAMVCAVTTPLHSLYQGSPHYGPWDKSDLRSHFTRPQNTFCQWWKKYLRKCVDLV